MRVLIACEFSGIVRDAFSALGHDAWSCDLLPSEKPGKHITGDISNALSGSAKYQAIGGANWDLLIAHPPCTYLCNSGVRWLAPGGKLDSRRHRLMIEAADFFASLLSADIPRVCVENPTMHKYSRNYLQETWRVLRHDARPTQTIQPWQFGDPESKRTCLWLRNLTPLVPTNILPLPECGHWNNQTRSGQNKLSPGPQRAAIRAKTYPGIAAAMAAQWSNLS